MSVLRKMHDLATSSREKATAWLLTGAIFFAMRSCEYLHTTTESTKRTKVITVGNIIFKKGTSIVHHSDPNLHMSDLVRITFEYQKNDKRDVCIHMFRSGDNTLCPVLAWAKTVQRVRSIPGASDSSKVCLFQGTSAKITTITADYVRSRLRAMVELLGEDKLGFTKIDIGLHSIRSGGAMAMFLSGTSVIIIMRVGRWSSEAFLEYIRDQVESFTADVSKNMLKHEQFFNLNPNAGPSSYQLDSNHSNTEDITSEDGVDSVPFLINFNKLALNDQEETECKK